MISAAAAKALSPYREAYRGALLPAVVVPGALSEPAAAELRAELSAAGFEPYWLADHGRYEVNDALAAPELFDSLREIAEHLAGAGLEVQAARWLGLRRGSYSLLRDDVMVAGQERSVELTLDLSAGSCGEAEVVYTHRGQVYFAAPQRPGALALVERGPTVRRYDRYLTHRVGAAEILRLRMALRFA